jgi:hypothetical protein
MSETHRFKTCARFAHDLQRAVEGQERAQPLTDDIVVVSDQEPYCLFVHSRTKRGRQVRPEFLCCLKL